MARKDLSGQVVTIMSSLGQIERLVVMDLGEILLVCRREEYDRAAKEGREPVAIGFKKVDVVA